jgi:hypothetical protein
MGRKRGLDTTRSFGAPTVREGGIPRHDKLPRHDTLFCSPDREGVFVNQKARHLIIKKSVSWMDERLKEIMRKRVNRS